MVKEFISINLNTKLPRNNKGSGSWTNPLSSEEIKYFNKVYNTKESIFIGIQRQRQRLSESQTFKILLDTLNLSFDDTFYFSIPENFIVTLESLNLNLSSELTFYHGNILELNLGSEMSVAVQVNLDTLNLSLTDNIYLFGTNLLDLGSETISLTNSLEYSVDIIKDLDTLIISLTDSATFGKNLLLDLESLNISLSNTLQTYVEYEVTLSDIDYLNSQVPDEDFIW